MATTGLVLARNARENLLTRITDVNIGTACVMMRASRSLLGALETTSGALLVYRAHVLFEHRDRYNSAGPYGDDRCLAMYSALEGEVVGVNEAVVWSPTPADGPAMYRQRLRWSQSWWCMNAFVLTNMDRFGRLFRPLFGLAQLVVAPMAIGYAAIVVSVNAYRGTTPWAALLLDFGLYLLVRYAETAFYLIERPGMSRWEKVWTWLLLTPVEAVGNLAFLKPTKYLALLKLKEHDWGTRGDAHASEVPPPEHQLAGTVYFGGQPATAEH
jgi:hyaluronan synthase